MGQGIADFHSVKIKRVPSLPGPAGSTGPAGNRGERGERGMPGERGERGERGISGERGERGKGGKDGEWGSAGERGVRGPMLIEAAHIPRDPMHLQEVRVVVIYKGLQQAQAPQLALQPQPPPPRVPQNLWEQWGRTPIVMGNLAPEVRAPINSGYQPPEVPNA